MRRSPPTSTRTDTLLPDTTLFRSPPLDEVFRNELRAAYDWVIVGAGGYDLAKAEQMLGAGYVDAVAFGRAFIANPDLPVRLADGIELSEVVQEKIGRAHV